MVEGTNKGPNHARSPLPCPSSLEDVDLFSPGAQEHWYEAYDILHAAAPVYRIPGEGFLPGTDAFVLTRHEDIARVVRDEARFPPVTSLLVEQLAARGGDPFEVDNVNVMLASMVSLRPNPALWRRHRQELTDPWVGPGATRHAPMIRELASSLVDAWIDRGTVEFVAEFAQPLPQMVMARVLGWPMADLHLLKTFGDATVRPFVYGRGHRNLLTREELAEQAEGLRAFRDYTAALIGEKRRAPADDMISFLTQVTYSPLGRKLTDNEINGIVYAMVIGGLETTQYALAESVQLLIERPDAWQALKAEPGRVRSFIEEAMRLRSPTQGLSTRITSRDEVFQDVPVPKGSYLHLRWGAANIDPVEWEDAKTLRLDRKAVTRHLAFSQGPRVCPGATLSRVEQTVAWNVLLERVRHFTYAADNDFCHQRGIMLGTLALNLNVAAA